MADIIFILESSQNVGKKKFKAEKDFVKAITHRLNVQSGKSRVAVINYGNIAAMTIAFGDFKDTSEFERLLDAMPSIGGNTQHGLYKINCITVRAKLYPFYFGYLPVHLHEPKSPPKKCFTFLIYTII